MPHKRDESVSRIEWTPPNLETYNRAIRLLRKIIDFEINGPEDDFLDAVDRFRRLPGYPNPPSNFHVVICRPEARVTSIGAN